MNKDKFNKKNFFGRGFTLIEIVIAMGIIILIFGFISVNLGGFTRSTSVLASVETLVSDIRNQQEKAISGAGSGIAGSDFGIYFLSDRYILFKGSSYSSSDPSNITVKLSQNINISNVAFSGSQVVFLQRSGEVKSFSSSADTLVINNTAGNELKTIRVNRYGTVDQVN